MADTSDLEKTEQPTESKINKARKKGQIPRSRELSSMVMLLVGMSMFWFIGSNIGVQLTLLMRHAIALSYQFMGDDRQMLVQFVMLIKTAFGIIFPLFLALVITAIAAPPFIGGLLFSTESLKFDLTRLSLFSGFKRIFSSRIFAELLKSILKVLLIALITGWFLYRHWSNILVLPTMDMYRGFSESMQLIIECGLLVILSLTPMVGFDIFYQIWSNIKKLKMTKQEIKEEYKEHEGDPHIKSRIRQMQQSLARRRMMEDVPKADVIITNPIHFAVALQYDEKTMNAPKVMAKGADLIAEKIKQLGSDHKIPQLEAPPLARALYRHAEIGGTIPTELYAAVAQVLAWVYQLKRWHQNGGIPPIIPNNLPVPKSLDFGLNTGDNQPNE